ncbi:MAG: hypothetical protein ACTSVI_01040 [Promethearchaeota archaeon]
MPPKSDPVHLFNIAEELNSNNQLMGAYENYKKAANIFFMEGSYQKISTIYRKIVETLKAMGKIGEAIMISKEMAKRLEDFKIYEEAISIHELIGELNYEIKDHENAARALMNAGELYWKLYEDEKNDVWMRKSGEFLIKAGEILYKIPSKKEKSEQLVLDGLFKYCGCIHDISKLEVELANTIQKNDFFNAKKIAGHIASTVLNMIDSLDNYRKFKEIKLKKNLTSRLLHIKSEYLFMQYLISRQIDDKDVAKKIGINITDKLQKSIEILKSLLNNEYDKEDLDRFGFDAMIMAIIKSLNNSDSIKEFETKIKTGLDKEIINLLDENTYFHIMKKIANFGLESVKNDLRNVPMGMLESLKNTLIKLIYTSI